MGCGCVILRYFEGPRVHSSSAIRTSASVECEQVLFGTQRSRGGHLFTTHTHREPTARRAMNERSFGVPQDDRSSHSAGADVICYRGPRIFAFVLLLTLLAMAAGCPKSPPAGPAA